LLNRKKNHHVVLQYPQEFSDSATVLFVEVPKEDRMISSTTESATAQTYRDDSNSHTHYSHTMTGPQLRVLTTIILQHALKKKK